MGASEPVPLRLYAKRSTAFTAPLRHPAISLARLSRNDWGSGELWYASSRTNRMLSVGGGATDATGAGFFGSVKLSSTYQPRSGLGKSVVLSAV